MNITIKDNDMDIGNISGGQIKVYIVVKVTTLTETKLDIGNGIILMVNWILKNFTYE